MPISRSWYDYLKSLPSAPTVPVVQTTLLFVPIDALFKLLNTSISEQWRAARQERPGLPVWKSVKSLFEFEFPDATRNLVEKFQRNAPARMPIRRLMSRGRKVESFWTAHPGWVGLFHSTLFRREQARLFWQQALEDAYSLNVQRFRAAELTLRERFSVYNEDPVTLRLGCAAGRAIMASRLEVCDETELHLDPSVNQALAADRISVLVRVCTWLMADRVVDNWDRVASDVQCERIPLISSLPKFDSASQAWNSSIGARLNELAKAVGQPDHLVTASFLARLWAPVDAPEKQLSTTRLIRNWQQGKGGRPDFESLLSLCTAVVNAGAARHGQQGLDLADDYRDQAWMLRFAETMGFIRQELTAAGFPSALIEAMFAVYEPEYRLARAAMGKPMLENSEA